MHKIGVITFWSGNENYGQILQCWALQEYLKSIGHEPYVIRYVPTKYLPPWKHFLKTIVPITAIRNIKLRFLHKREYEEKKQCEIKSTKRNFEEFRKCHLCFSERTYTSLAQLRKHPPLADAYITGSDQVWAQLLTNRNNRTFFLDFGPFSVKRLSYAPSFAMDAYPEEQKDELKKLLEKFNAVSVRENAGVEICRAVGINAVRTIDPTMLLNVADYRNLFSSNSGKTASDYIFIYSLNIKTANDIRWSELRKLAISSECRVKVTPAQGYFSGSELFGSEVDYVYATPTEWLALINDAKAVVTASFHGIVFSIILEVPFVYVPLKGDYSAGNSRVIDLLSDLQLKDRILSEGVTYESILSSRIEWGNVKKRLAQLSDKSKDFLATNL